MGVISNSAHLQPKVPPHLLACKPEGTFLPLRATPLSGCGIFLDPPYQMATCCRPQVPSLFFKFLY